MSPYNVKDLFRLAWLRAKETEGLADDDPIVKSVQTKVIRTIAELEVSRLPAEESASPTGSAVETIKDEDEPTISAVA